MNPTFDVMGRKIETERLILRPFEESDLMDLYTYASVAGVGEAAGWPAHENIETSREILNMFLEKKDNFAVYHKADQKVIGSLGLRYSWTSRNEKYKHLKAKEIGYVLSKDYWGQGLATEAVKAVIDYGYQVLLLDAFGIAHFGENDKSRRVVEKCGFTYIETGKYFSKQLQKEYDDIRYILLPKYTLQEVNDPDIKSEICNNILRALPNWFGDEESIVEYVAQVKPLPFYAVYDENNPIAFVAITPHNKYTAEIHVMGILEEYHRQGIGKMLVNCAKRYCAGNNLEFLTVKTLDEKHPDEFYAKTREFYFSMGFKPLQVFPLLWGEHNPCLFLVKTVKGEY